MTQFNKFFALYPQSLVALAVLFLQLSCNAKTDPPPKEQLSIVNSTSYPTLQKQLDALSKYKSTKGTPANNATMDKWMNELKAKGAKALKKGNTMPNFTLKDLYKNKFDTKELLKKGPLVLVFVRGLWDDFDLIQANSINRSMSAFKAAGATVLYVVPHDIKPLPVKQIPYKFDAVIDNTGAVTKSFKLLHPIPADVKAIYLKNNFDLSKINKYKTWDLPINATYVVSQDGKIVFSEINADYHNRPETSEILKVVKSLPKSKAEPAKASDKK